MVDLGGDAEKEKAKRLVRGAESGGSGREENVDRLFLQHKRLLPLTISPSIYLFNLSSSINPPSVYDVFLSFYYYFVYFYFFLSELFQHLIPLNIATY